MKNQMIKEYKKLFRKLADQKISIIDYDKELLILRKKWFKISGLK